LLHCCCAPCSSACLEKLKDYFDVTVLFYNPNITDGEYLRRKDELVRFIDETGWADKLDCDHESEKFYSAVKGLEKEPEGGKRCEVCFKLRLEKTASLAEEHGFDYFTTTLTISPLKDAALINAIGESLQSESAKWLYSDFKKRGGYLRSCALSKEHNLYRQDYCGCAYSVRQKT
ncbi:MAG: epoxyqueuosine reductase QueH, partial [Clostridia bacterium]|nr:epoxyqueuosine reductase QueH [Clostridia bacterium]